MVDGYAFRYYNESANKHNIVRKSVPSVPSIVRIVVLVKYIWAYSRTFVVMHKKEGTEMCTLYERIQALCKSKGVSGSRMCLDLGLSKSTLSDIKSGRKKGVSTATAQKIASYFNVSVGYLLGEEEQKEKPTVIDDGLSDEKLELIERIKKLPEDQVQLLLQVAKSIK